MDSDTATERFEMVEPVVEDWSILMCFLTVHLCKWYSLSLDTSLSVVYIAIERLHLHDITDIILVHTYLLLKNLGSDTP